MFEVGEIEKEKRRRRAPDGILLCPRQGFHLQQRQAPVEKEGGKLEWRGESAPIFLPLLSPTNNFPSSCPCLSVKGLTKGGGGGGGG